MKSNFLSRVFSKEEMGTVHSVFNNSLNLTFGGQLIHIGKQKEGVSAFGMVLKDDLMEELLSSVSVGNLVKKRDAGLVIYTRFEVWRIWLDALEEWDCRIPYIEMTDGMQKSLSHFGILQKSGLEDQADLLEEFMGSSWDDHQFQQNFIQHFIGRGIGLTPSGDDLLMGMMIVLSALNSQKMWLTLLKEQLEERRTTAVSEAYYHALMAGYTSSHFITLLHAMEEGHIEEAVQDISRYGHTSGWDTLLGIELVLKKGGV